MAIALVAKSGYYAGAAATTHTISGLSIPIGSCVVVLGGFRSNVETNITVVTTTPAGAGSWSSMNRTPSNTGATAEQAGPGLNYTLTTTAVITAITFAMQTSALASVSASCTFSVAWFSGVDTAGTVQRPSAFKNAATTTQNDPSKTPTTPVGSLIVNVNAGSISSSSTATATANASGAAAVSPWTELVNASGGTAGTFTLGGGQSNTTNVTAYGHWGATLDLATNHQIQWTQGGTQTKYSGAVIIPVASAGGGAAAVIRRQGKRAY